MKVPNFNDTVRDNGGALSESVQRGPRCRAALTVLRGPSEGGVFTLGEGDTIIGRSPDVDIVIPDDMLSRRHARISRVGAVFVVEDLDSTNGTRVDGTTISGPYPLDDGARVHVGTRSVLHFRLHDEVELQAVQQSLDRALRDPLTGVFNRRHLEDHFAAEVAFSQRHGTPLSLLLLDVDHFKRINDQYGHPAGDVVLCSLAEALSGLTRAEDLVARYGGEEFALVARGIDLNQAVQLAERVRQTAMDQRVATEAGTVSFTVSVGVAFSEGEDHSTPHEMFAAADRALYASKDAGRNTISIAPPPNAG